MKIRLAALVAVVCLGLPPTIPAQTVDLGSAFGSRERTPLLSGEEILRRALDNLFGFDARISVRAERRGMDGRATTSEFLLMRKRAEGARRMLAISIRPAAVRGSRALQINYDDGREETYAFVQSIRGEPVRARYRISEPFLGTWHEIESGDPPAQLLALSEHEVLGVEPGEAQGEPVYRVTLRPLASRGYEHSELFIARRDYAILEWRHYLTRAGSPALIAVAPRASMVRFAGRLVPQRMLYRDLADASTIEVTLRHEALPDGADPLFFPTSFHLVPLARLDSPAGKPNSGGSD